MTSTAIRAGLLIGCAAIASALSSASLAQASSKTAANPALSPLDKGKDATGESTAVSGGDIVVTARRTNETLLSAPIAVNAFDAATIDRAGITRPGDFIGLIPNVNFFNTSEAGDTQVIIRGVLNTRDVDPSFALVVDGVSQPNPNALNRELVDIDQIEVVKGPVSALYGRNALAGAILIKTKKPTDEFSGRILGSVGNGSLKRIGASISGPIIKDTLYFSAAGAYRDFGGIFRNEFAGGHVDYYKEGRAHVRLLWTPTSRLTVDVTGDYSDIKGHAEAYNLQVPGRPDVQPQFVNHIDVNDTSLPYRNNVRSINPAKRYDASVKADWQLSDAVTLTGLFGYDKATNLVGSDFIVDFSNPALVPEAPDHGLVGYTSAPGSIAFQTRNEIDYTYELRLSSNSTGPFTWQMGAFHGNLDREVYVAINLDNMNGVISTQPAGPQTALINEWLGTKTRVNSGYVQASYDITPQLQLSVAGRYDDERRTSTNLNNVFNALFNPFPGQVRKASDSRFQPRTSLRWKPVSTVTLYASYGQGFRAGGYNAPGTRALVLAVDQLPATTNIRDTYKAESLRGYEAGVKTELLDRRLFLGGNIFLNNVHNAQIFEFTPVTSTRARLNIDRTRTTGFEVEATYKLTSLIDMNASYGYTKAIVRQNAADPTIVGNPLLGVPKDTLNAGVSAEQPLAGSLSATMRLEYQRIGKTPWDLRDQPGTVRDPVDLVNMRLGLKTGKFSIVGFADNLFNKHYNVESIISNSGALGLINFAYKAQTRTYGVDVSYRF